MSGFIDYLRMLMGWWSATQPPQTQLCFNASVEPMVDTDAETTDMISVDATIGCDDN